MICAVLIILTVIQLKISTTYLVHHLPAMPPPTDGHPASPDRFDSIADVNANADADADANANLARVRQTSFLPHPPIISAPR